MILVSFFSTYYVGPPVPWLQFVGVGKYGILAAVDYLIMQQCASKTMV